MTTSEVRTAIEQSLGAVAYEAPVSVAYCVAVRDDLRTRVPTDAKIDVYHRHRTLAVEVRAGSTEVCVVLDLV